jgi:DNA-binding IclR family transcriptional regulator
MKDVLRERLQNTVEPDVWTEFVVQAALARSQGHYQKQNRNVKLITDFSVPIIAGDSVVAALTSPYTENLLSIPVVETIARLDAAAKEIAAAMG